MTDTNLPQSLNVPLAKLVDLCIEHWRLSTWLAGSPMAGRAPAAAHALRKWEDFLKSFELETVSLDGRPHDAGLAATVIDTVDEPTLPHGQTVVIETLSPIVLWRGQVVKTAEVVTGRGTAGQ